MKSGKELYNERLERIRKAIALEPVDKIPVLGSGPAAYAAMSGVDLADYLEDMKLNCDVNLKFHVNHDLDGAQAHIFSPDVFPRQWFSKVCTPGRELPSRNELWQVHEMEIIKQEDYDDLLKMGYAAWQKKILDERFTDVEEREKPFYDYAPIAAQRYAEAGVPVIVGSIFESPFEVLCGGRSLECFLMDDIFEIPELLDDVFAEIHQTNMVNYEELLKSPAKPLGVWVGGWRGTPTMLNREMFEHYSWRYMKEIAELCIRYDVIPIFHLDADWTPGLDVFKEIEPKKAIMALDSKTDIYKAKEVVGDRMCIMGDVPAELFAFGDPQKVYDYAAKLIRDLGPTGYIMCSGCDIPFNAKKENVEAMYQAVADTAGNL